MDYNPAYDEEYDIQNNYPDENNLGILNRQTKIGEIIEMEMI